MKTRQLSHFAKLASYKKTSCLQKTSWHLGETTIACFDIFPSFVCLLFRFSFFSSLFKTSFSPNTFDLFFHNALLCLLSHLFSCSSSALNVSNPILFSSAAILSYSDMKVCTSVPLNSVQVSPSSDQSQQKSKKWRNFVDEQKYF